MQYNKLITFFISLLFIAGCKKEDLTIPGDKTAESRSIGSFIRNNYDLTLLSAALEKAGLSDSLNQPGPFTFFAPDNAAFNSIGITSAKDFETMNVDSLRFALKCQGFRDRKYISDFPFQLGNRYVSMAGPEMYVSVSKNVNYGSGASDRTVYVNGAYVYSNSKRNIALANGVVHVVRMPFRYTQGTVQDFLMADTSLSLFVTAMKRFKLWDGLKEKGPFTVFAPHNDAFRKYDLTADSINKMDPDKFQAIAFGIYSLIQEPRHIFSTDWQQINVDYGGISTYIHLPGFSIKPYYNYNEFLQQETHSITVVDDAGQSGINGPYQVHYKNGVAMGADHIVTNGIVHIVDDLLLYPQTLIK
ncbi:hypothetical protein GO495_04665 [Chitinophaga oryziterrae]|uniref:FAS1 domain-containing protein n=1 Tax=Chitinophaga oryziterrae TaxID=1031224 RepID=A0A6N8J3R1_9BACT|nr:fasciclin domain-containing protein [Chitinophaga oryziterrae]MVT39865.1 hypothetical protein [Chitinophaga oryziterrae]